MTTRSVTINFPDELYDRLRQRAEQTGRSIESELVGIVAVALPDEDGLSLEVTSELASLALLDDESLWRAARTRLAAEGAVQMEDLHFKQRGERLTAPEAQTLASLEWQADRVMLIRAQAAVLLKERGFDISPLLDRG